LPLFSQFPSGFSADDLRKSLAANRAQFYHDFASKPFYGFNRPGAKPLGGVVENWWRQGMMGGAKAHYDGIKAFSETDLTEDLKSIDVPTLVMQGEDDQVVPYKGAAWPPSTVATAEGNASEMIEGRDSDDMLQ
jgi:pimeloyl-ACP methyl ester carboxylesterase